MYSLSPFSENVKRLKRRQDLFDFAYSDIRLYGGRLTSEGVKSVLAGNAVPGVPVFEHRLCEAHRTLISRFEEMLHMAVDTDSQRVEEFCEILRGAAAPHRGGCASLPWRKGLPLLYHLDFVPGDDDRIQKDMAEMFATVRKIEREGFFGKDSSYDFCLKAAAIHMGIVEVYPFADGFSELSARAAMQYEIVRAGYFPIDPGISETEYNDYTATAIKTGDLSGFAGLLRDAVCKKIQFFIDAIVSSPSRI